MALQRRPRHRPALCTFEDYRNPPSACTGEAYSVEFRDCCTQLSQTGILNVPEINHLRNAGRWPSQRSVRRWARRLLIFGNLRRFKRTGNNRATVLCGRFQFFLAFYRAIYPTASQAEINAFLFTEIQAGDPLARFFSPSQITECENRLGFSRKRGSTTARQALLPINIIKRDIYWNENYPAGVADIPARDIIDIDEAGIFLETAARKIGKISIGSRVREEGPYGHSVKYTLTMAIGGDHIGERWVDFSQKAGTTAVAFFRLYIGYYCGYRAWHRRTPTVLYI